MITEGMVRAGFKRVSARRKAEAGKPEDAATPQETLVRAAENGRFETIVAAAQPAEPPKMVTPEEREAERRRTGQGPDEPKVRRKAAPKPAPKEPARPLTPNEEFIAEHCRWRARRPGDDRAPVPYGQCLTEYDVLSGEIIGDGYDHSGEEDDQW